MLRNDLFRPWFVGEKDWGVEIIDGEFSGVVVQIRSIEFSEKNDGSVNLDFNVIKRPEALTEEDTKGEMFNRTMELIINDILKEAVEEHEQARNNNSEELGTQ